MTTHFKIILFRILLFCECFILAWSRDIVELTAENFNSKITENKCVFIYATTENCAKCNILYHKYLTTAQTFEKEDRTTFGRLSDKTLLQAFDVTSFPGIVYYEYGSAMPKLYLGDVTSGALTKLVADVTNVNFKTIDRQHSLILTHSNFDEIMNTDKQTRMVMLHRADDIGAIDSYEEIAETFDNEVDVVIARINVDFERKLKKQFNAISYPSFYWYPKGSETKKKRYGGTLNVAQMISFINRECNFFRTKGGRLNPYAGLIKQLDEVINSYGKDLYDISNIGVIRKEMKREIARLPSDTDYDLAEFYLFLLDEINEDKTIETLDENRSRLFRQMERVGPLEFDQLLRKINIVQKYIDIIGNHLLEELSGGSFGEPLKIDQDYGFVEHGLEFHEEL